MTSPVVIRGDDSAVALAGLDNDLGAGELTVFLGDTEPTSSPSVHWQRGASQPSEADRVIAQAGEGMWRRAPWPVRDSLFDLARAETPGEVVTVDGRLSPVDLSRADVVTFATAGPLPAEAMAVIAAGRILVLPPVEPAFGLTEELDHLVARSDSDVEVFADAVRRHPRAFEQMRVLGRMAAEHHRASVVYARLVHDLRLEGVIPTG